MIRAEREHVRVVKKVAQSAIGLPTQIRNFPHFYPIISVTWFGTDIDSFSLYSALPTFTLSFLLHDLEKKFFFEPYLIKNFTSSVFPTLTRPIISITWFGTKINSFGASHIKHYSLPHFCPIISITWIGTEIDSFSPTYTLSSLTVFPIFTLSFLLHELEQKLTLLGPYISRTLVFPTFTLLFLLHDLDQKLTLWALTYHDI